MLSIPEEALGNSIKIYKIKIIFSIVKLPFFFFLLKCLKKVKNVN